MRYRFIEMHRARWPLALMCRVLEVHRQGYHRWRKGRDPEQEKIRQELEVLIATIFTSSRGTYGVRRIYNELKSKGKNAGIKLVGRIMREQGLRAKGKRKYRPTTDSSKTTAPAKNLLKQHGALDGQDQAWVSDFTELPCRRGKAYAVAIMDLYTRRILAILVASSMKTDTLLEAFDVAVATRGRRKLRQTIFHSDRGVQFNAHAFRDTLAKHDFRQSMSGTGNCYDNAAMESFWARMKTEIGLRTVFENVQHARRVISEWTYVFYNRMRIHSGINYMPPVQFENHISSLNSEQAH